MAKKAQFSTFKTPEFWAIVVSLLLAFGGFAMGYGIMDEKTNANQRSIEAIWKIIGTQRTK